MHLHMIQVPFGAKRQLTLTPKSGPSPPKSGAKRKADSTWPPTSTVSRQQPYTPGERRSSENARVKKGVGPYEGASQQARPGRALTIPTSPLGSTDASTTHGIPPPAAPPPGRSNALQLVGGPRPAPAVGCSDSNPNLQADRDYSPVLPDPSDDTNAVPRWARQVFNELIGKINDDEENGNEEENGTEEEDRCELPLCAPRLLIAGGYNRHYSEAGVGMLVRACLHAYLHACLSFSHIWQEPPHITALRKCRLMHSKLYQALFGIAPALMESARDVEDTCIPDLAYSNARLQPRPFLFLQFVFLALWE